MQPLSIKILNKLAEFKHSKLIKQSDIAVKTGLNQSTVSRILNGRVKSMNKSVQKVCDYLEINENTSSKINPKDCKVLMDALSETWDGSNAHAIAISEVIKSLNYFN